MKKAFKKSNGRVERIALLALTLSLAMLLSFIESQLPSFAAIPGIKVGLANIAVIFALYRFGAPSAIGVSLVRVILISLLFGNLLSMVYGLSGACLALLVMILLKKLVRLSPITVSVLGGVCHNIGQIAAACFILDTAKILYYLPFLILSGTIAGIAVGVASGILVKRLG